MSWLEQLQPASFRGVPFQVDTVDVTAGDHNVVREYPFQDLPTVFSMGAGLEEFRFAAYVIGVDYTQRRDALRAVLSGPGELVHPTAGTVWAHVSGRYSVREAPTAEGGMARFDLTFVRATAQRFPDSRPATTQQAAQAVAVAREAAVATFAAEWSTQDQPSVVSEAASARVATTVDVALSAMAGVRQEIGGTTTAAISAFSLLRTGLDELMSEPRRLGDALAQLLALPVDLSEASRAAWRATTESLFDLRLKAPEKAFEVVVQPRVGQLALYGAGTPLAAAAGGSGTREVSARLTAASDRLIELLATCAWVESVAATPLDAYEQAADWRMRIHAQCRRLLQAASADLGAAGPSTVAWHDAVLGLLTAVLADLQARSRDLVRLTTYTPPCWQSIWQISHALFGTVAHADEIAAMNPHIEHPLLVPPGRPLRVVRHEP